MRLGVEIAALVAVPVALGICVAVGFEQTALFSLVVVVAALALFFAGYDRSRPQPRDFVPATILAALAVAGRLLFAPIASFKPVSAIAIIGGIMFGRRTGFMVGALAALVSNFFLGQGPWTPWQMYAWGLVGYLGGVLEQAGVFRRRGAVLVYGFLSGLLYGLIINLWSIIGFYHPQTMAQFAGIYAAALPFDLVHSVATVIFLAVLYYPWRTKLERVKRKYGF